MLHLGEPNRFEEVNGRKSASLHIGRKDDVPELLEEVILFFNSDDNDWIMEEELNDGDDDERSENDGSDNQLGDINSIESIDLLNSD